MFVKFRITELSAHIGSLESAAVFRETQSLILTRPAVNLEGHSNALLLELLAQVPPSPTALQSSLDCIMNLILHPFRIVKFLHIGLALILCVGQSVFIFQLLRSNLISLKIVLRRDYFTIIVDAIIDQMTMRIVGIMMPYQEELGVLNPH